MNGFDAIYAQTVTIFNRIPGTAGESTMWIPTVIDGVHLIASKASSWNSNGGSTSDNVQLHIRYSRQNGDCVISCNPELGGYGSNEKVWREPKAWKREHNPESEISFCYGDNDDFDFFIEGAVTEFTEPVPDDKYTRSGFYGYMNARYDNVFAITGVQKFNLIPHFEITAR